MSTKETFDYVIIGGGAAGCVVANRLTADGDLNVLLLEAGIADDAPEFHDALAVIDTWKPEYDWGYVSAPVPGLNDRTIPIMRGKVLGGSTSVHAMLHVRGNRRDYDAWNFLGNEGWSYEDVLPYFKKSEDFEGGASAYRGKGGPLSVIYNPEPTVAATAFCEAAVEAGFRGPNWDYNGELQENTVGLYQLVCTKDRKRASASAAFLDPARERSNLTVLTKAEATRLLIDKERVTGVEYIKDGKTCRVIAQREVIVSGGTYHSPKLLMLSGIGPADHLREHGIDVAVNLPGVGKNLIDHVLLPLLYHSKTKLPEPAFIAEAGLFAHSRPEMNGASPDIQLNFNAGVHRLAPPGLGDFFGFVMVLVQPQSRGTVTLRSSKPLDAPVVQLNYMACETDIGVMREAIRLSRKLAKTKPLSEFSDGEVNLGTDKSEEEIRGFILGNCSTIWHPVGTCKMGRDAMGVVDPQLRVYGLQGLRVADASVMPTIPAGNTAAACMMIGEKVSDLILSGTR